MAKTAAAPPAEPIEDSSMPVMIIDSEPTPDRLKWLSPLFANTIRNYSDYNRQFDLAGGDTVSSDIIIENGSYFACDRMTMIVTSDDGSIIYPFKPILVQIKNSSPGISLFQNPVHANEIFGDAFNNVKLPMPYIFPPSATIQSTFANQIDTDLVVHYSFHGVKLYGDSDILTGAMNQ